MRFLVVAFWALFLVNGTSAAAQTPAAILSPGAIVEGELSDGSPTLAEGGRYGCYAIETRAGDQVTVTLRSQAFDSRLWIARGGLCSAAALQHDNDNFEDGSRDARVSFRAAGGRYLILARGRTAEDIGSYQLSVEGGASVQTASNTTAGEAERLAIMQRQVSQRQAEVAAAEEQRRQQEAARQQAAAEAARHRREAEARRRADDQAFLGALVTGSVQAFSEVAVEMEQQAAREQAQLARMQAEQAAREAQRAEVQRQALLADQRRTQQQPAQTAGLSPEQVQAQERQRQDALRRAEEQRMIQQAEARRVAQQQQAAQQQQNDAQARLAQLENQQRMAQLGAQNASSGATAPSSTPAASIRMIEAVVVCPLSQDRLFGELTCYGPFQNGLSNPNDSSDIGLACGREAGAQTDFGERDGHRIWGCGFGLDPTRAGRSPNIDMAERYSLILPQRRYFNCPAGTDYCRTPY